MRAIAITTDEHRNFRRLLDDMHRLRARVFGGRLGWAVNVEDGRERDEYDALGPTYILALTDQGEVAGCARLLTAMGPTMRNGHFRSCSLRGIWPRPTPRSRARASAPTRCSETGEGGHRFKGLLPPVVGAPAFTIRKRAAQLIPLDAYVTQGIMTDKQVTVIRNAVSARLNIVISGGTGSGKTTLANAIVAAMIEDAPEHRLIILEDTVEIQCAAENAVSLHTSDTVDMGEDLRWKAVVLVSERRRTHPRQLSNNH